MYIRIFGRKEAETLFALLCDGCALRMVQCLQTTDPQTAEHLARRMAADHVADPDRVALLWDVPDSSGGNGARHAPRRAVERDLGRNPAQMV